MTYRDGASEQCGSSREIDVLWVTAGLGCDGDTIAITAATQPSLEEIVQGAIPGIPKVNFHNPFLSYENGEDFMEFFYRAAEGKIEPFILVIEGSIPNEDNKDEGYWAAFGINVGTGKNVSFCLFKSCSHQGFTGVFAFLHIRCHRVPVACWKFCPQIGHTKSAAFAFLAHAPMRGSGVMSCNAFPLSFNVPLYSSRPS